MTVQELIDQLLLVEDKSRTVIVSSDPEGNRFRKLQELGQQVCRHESGEDYEIGYEKLTPKLIEFGYTEEDLISNGEGCVVLWP